ncbi:male-specific histamine-binding salivary protein-like [Rhipicephalus sanguineus]|uniref:male-specific histamine-binding salivary protein-like n=1 Tax=Rhipicephalus sanguineus TaxID=34632 RepID=UPI001895E42D|nr:male-specific histamine-binding salivary protein-like [Rhipicephalus sanguineus]
MRVCLSEVHAIVVVRFFSKARRTRAARVQSRRSRGGHRLLVPRQDAGGVAAADSLGFTLGLIFFASQPVSIMTSAPKIATNILLQLLCIALTSSLGAEELLERKPYLSTYQDAWKALKAPGKYYLYMRSYAEEPFYGEGSKCVFTDLISVNEEEKYTTNLFGYTIPCDGSVKNQTVYAWARASDGYDTPNVIESSPSIEKKHFLDYALAFSEYDNCDILRLPHRQNACELWAKEGGVDKIKSHCFFIFHLLCGPEKHVVYEKDLCENK